MKMYHLTDRENGCAKRLWTVLTVSTVSWVRDYLEKSVRLASAMNWQNKGLHLNDRFISLFITMV
jgi:hypothetical protein